jgi:hypothetical protein
MGLSGLKSLQFLEDAIHHSTENPLAEIWDTFLRLTDIGYLTPRWKGRPEPEYLEVATLLAQAHEYHTASNTVTLNTKPLLIYYSFLNLTKAVLFMAMDKRPSDYHGLCKPSAGQGFLDFSIETNKGVFLSLADFLGEPVPEKRKIPMRHFISNLIELRHAYADYFQAKPSIYAPHVDVFLSGGIGVSFGADFVLKERLMETAVYKRLLEDFDAEPKDDKGVYLKAKSAAGPLDIMKKHFSFSVFADRSYYLNFNEPDILMSQAVGYYGMMYVLATIVRYEPGEIHKYLNDRNTSHRWFLQKACATAQRVYPNLLLNILFGKNQKFVVPTGL